MKSSKKLKAITVAAQAVIDHSMTNEICNLGARCYMDETEALGLPYAQAYPCSCLKELFDVIRVDCDGKNR